MVHAAVGEAGVGRCHLHGTQAMGQTAQTQGGGVDIVGHQVQPQLFRGEGIGGGGSQLFHHLHRHGVDGAGHTLGQRGPAGVAVGRVLGPGIVVQQAHRVVVKGGGHGDGAGIQCRGIYRQGLDGGTGLAAAGGVVPDEVCLLLPHLAHHGNDIAGVGVDDGDAGLQLLSAAGGHIQIAPVLID